MNIEELDFTCRTHNALKRGGIKTVEDIQRKGREGITRIRDVGKRSVDEVAAKLEERGIPWE